MEGRNEYINSSNVHSRNLNQMSTDPNIEVLSNIHHSRNASSTNLVNPDTNTWNISKQINVDIC